MEREDILKFTNSIVVLSKLLAKIEDKFFAQKLYGKMTDMAFAFIKYQPVAQMEFNNAEGIAKSDYIVQRSVNIAQYNSINLLNSINNLLDYLEYLVHVLKNDATPLLVAQKNLLKFKLFILKQNKSRKYDITQNVRQPAGAAGLPPNVNPRLTSMPARAAMKTKTIRTDRVELKPDSNKEKILNFIKKSPDIRAKEIMNKFNILSNRTVKRNLKELTDEGFLNKRFNGGAVYYFAAESN